MNAKNLLVLSLLSLSGSAWAQNCGGMVAVNGVCIPPDSPTSPLHSTYGQQPAQPPAPRIIWADRWGAIAFDNGTGSVGIAAKMSSKRKAEKAALADCRADRGRDCKVNLAYHNQCSAIAWGKVYRTTAGAGTRDQASARAVETCGQKSEGCKIVYTDCSMPERIQ